MIKMMKMMKLRLFLCGLLATFFASLALPAQTQSGTASDPQNKNEYAQVKEVPRAQINAWLKSKIAERGGDWEKGRYRFVLGFSTGHFAQDPVHAIAMRRVAFSLLNNSFAPGDRVTPLAWEMTLWKQGETVTLTDGPESRAKVVNEVPYSPQENSEGGHDIERTLYETLTRAVSPQQAPSTVILLLTNTNQSQAPDGRKASLFGENNSQLKSAELEKGMHTPLERQSFALKSETGRLINVEVTALFPEKMTSLTGTTSEPRFPTFSLATWQPAQDRPAATETLPNPYRPENNEKNPPNLTQTEKPTPDRGFPLWLIPLIIFLLLLMAGIAFAARKPGNKPKPKVETVGNQPATRPLPGLLRLRLGTESPEIVLDKLTIGTRLLLASGELVTEEEGTKRTNEQKEGRKDETLATLVWGNDALLTVTAPLGAEFTDRKGNAEKASTAVELRLLPGEGLICRLVTAPGEESVRLELTYKK